MCRAMPLAEVTTLGVAGAIAGAFLGPAVAVVACPILAAAGGMLGDAMVRGKGRAYAIALGGNGGWLAESPTVVQIHSDIISYPRLVALEIMATMAFPCLS